MTIKQRNRQCEFDFVVIDLIECDEYFAGTKRPELYLLYCFTYTGEAQSLSVSTDSRRSPRLAARSETIATSVS